MARPDTTAKTSRFIMLATICLVVAAVYLAQDVLIPLALAVLFTFLLTPVVVRIERRGVPRVPAVISVVLLGLGLVALLGWTVSNQAVDLAYSLPRYKQNIADKLSHLPFLRGGPMTEMAKTFRELEKEVGSSSTQPSTTQPAPAAATPSTSLTQSLADAFANALRTGPPLPVAVHEETPAGLGVLRNLLSTVAAPLGTAFIVIVFVIFMLLRREDLRDRLIRLVGESQLDVTTQALNDAGDRISRYLLMQSIINTAYGIAIGTGLWTIGKLSPEHAGFPNAALWGLLCGLFRFVPYVGPWLGGLCPVLLSFAVFPGISQFGYTICLFVGIEIINNSAVEPVMYGSSTGLSAIAILAAAVFWTWLWGPIGLLLSTPLTVCVVVIGKYVPQMQFLDILLGDEPVLAPPTRLYQRLLAVDTEEAADVVEEFRKTMPLEELYDTVILPALAMSEQDRHSGLLEEERHNTIRRNLRELVEELGDRERAAAVKAEAQAVEKAAQNGTEPPSKSVGISTVRSTSRPRLPQDCVVKVLCLPAHDEADEIAGIMLSQLLELLGYRAFPISQNALASEMVEEVTRKAADLVVVSAVPPAAVTHARYLCKRLHGRHPDVAMVVGLWTMQGDLKRPQERIACTGMVRFTATLRGALDEIHQLAQAKIVSIDRRPVDQTPAPAPAGV